MLQENTKATLCFTSSKKSNDMITNKDGLSEYVLDVSIWEASICISTLVKVSDPPIHLSFLTA